MHGKISQLKKYLLYLQRMIDFVVKIFPIFVSLVSTEKISNSKDNARKKIKHTPLKADSTIFPISEEFPPTK